jgi:hypothetical protein
VHRARAKDPGLLLRLGRWPVPALADAESVGILEFECSFEVHETMEMIAAISMALSPNVVLAAKEVDKCHKFLNFPVGT